MAVISFADAPHEFVLMLINSSLELIWTPVALNGDSKVALLVPDEKLDFFNFSEQKFLAVKTL